MVQNNTNKGLSKKQREAAEMLANPDCRRTKTEIIEKCGVSRSTFYRWLREDEQFVGYVNLLIDKYTDGELATVWKALVAKCTTGDVKAIKLFFELKGKYSQSLNVKDSIRIIDDI